MHLLHRTRAKQQRGFSLPEIMVGMVIGMIGIIIIMQVTSVFEGRKRTTSGGDDAQNAGAIALYGLQRDVSQAGYGISSVNLIAQPLALPFLTIDPLLPATVNPAVLAGVGDANTDTFIIIYGSNNQTTEGALINNPTATLPYQVVDGTGDNGTSQGGKAFHIGNWVIPSQSGVTTTHTLYQVVGPVSNDSVAVSGVPPTLFGTVNQANPPLLYNLGSSPSVLAYAVIDGFLSVCNYMDLDCDANTANWTRLSGNVVNMRVQCEGSIALRIALIIRSTQKDARTTITTSTPIWNPNGISAPVTASPTADWGTDWGNYRYKTFETMIPIRNALWTGVPGC